VKNNAEKRLESREKLRLEEKKTNLAKVMGQIWNNRPAANNYAQKVSLLFVNQLRDGNTSTPAKQSGPLMVHKKINSKKVYWFCLKKRRHDCNGLAGQSSRA